MKRGLVVALVVVVLGGVAAVVWSRATRCTDVNVAVFLDPDISVNDEDAVLAEIKKVESEVVHIDQLDAYREFQEMFHQRREKALGVEPADLPTSYRATMDKGDAVALQRRLSGRPDVENVQLWPCEDDLLRRPPPPEDDQRSSRNSSMVRTGSALTGTTLSVVTPASR